MIVQMIYLIKKERLYNSYMIQVLYILILLDIISLNLVLNEKGYGYLTLNMLNIYQKLLTGS